MRRIKTIASTQARNFSATTRYRIPTPPSRYNTEGRTPGFARRQPAGPAQGPHGSQQQPVPEESSPADQPSSVPEGNATNKNEQLSTALQQTAENNSNGLLSPVHIPEDQHGILKSNHPSTSLLANSSIIIQRQLEMMNVFLGFEQANRYIVMDPQGGHIGYLAEQEHGIGNTVARQMLRTHRSFTTHVFDRHEREVLRFHRPFSWVSSRIRVYDALNSSTPDYQSSSALQGTSMGSMNNQASAQISPYALSDMRIIGEAQQEWAPLRRKYNLFLYRELSQDPSNPKAAQLTAGNLPLSNSTALQTTEQSDDRQMGFAQFAAVNEPFLSWDFGLLSADQRLIGSVNRNFAGWGRELFTDTGVYALRMDAAGVDASQTLDRADVDPDSAVGMTLDQRAVMLATAVSIDFDYFSRHSSAGHGGFMPMWFPMGWGGGGAAGETGAATEAGAAGTGAAEAGGAGTAVQEAQQAARGVGAGEGAVTGAATMAGYEAMRGGRESSSQSQEQELPPQDMKDDDHWDPWGGGGQNSGGGGGNGEGEGGGGGIDVDEWF